MPFGLSIAVCRTTLLKERQSVVIISHKYQLVFIKSRKTAGSSLEIALSRYLGEEDVITPCMPIEEEAIRKSLGYRSAQNFELPIRRWKTRDAVDFLRGNYPKRFSSHSTAARIEKEMGSYLLKKYKVVLTVRNPYDYVVSLYRWHARGKAQSVSDFIGWLERGEGDLRFSNWGMGKVNGESVVDLALRFENMPDSIIELCNQTGLPNSLLETFKSISAKASSVRPEMTPEKIYGQFPEGLSLVANKFAEEIELFGYQFHPHK